MKKKILMISVTILATTASGISNAGDFGEVAAAAASIFGGAKANTHVQAGVVGANGKLKNISNSEGVGSKSVTGLNAMLGGGSASVNTTVQIGYVGANAEVHNEATSRSGGAAVAGVNAVAH